MKNVLIYILVLAAFTLICYSAYKEVKHNTIEVDDSTPVGKIYHKQLVNIIDSIVDSRYPCGVTEDDNAYPYSNPFSSVAVPDNKQ